MKLKPLIVLFLLAFLTCSHAVAVGKEKKSPITLNGKKTPKVVAKVNGIELTSEVLQRELFAFRFQSKQMGKEIKPSEEYQITRNLLKSVVARELLVQKAKSLGIKIAEKKIDLELKNIEDQFPSHKSFITSLAFQHMSIKSLKEKIYRTLLEDELMRHEIAPNVTVSDDSIKKYYEDNRANFIKPVLYRLRHIHVVTISPVEKAEDEISQEKAERLIKTINAEAKTKIYSLLKRVQAGESFSNLARRFTEDDSTKQKGGLLGDLHPDSTITEIAEEMVKLKEEETSEVIQSKFGYHILKLDEIIPSKLIPFSDTKSDIMILLLKRETQKLFTSYVEDLGNSANIEIFF